MGRRGSGALGWAVRVPRVLAQEGAPSRRVLEGASCMCPGAVAGPETPEHLSHWRGRCLAGAASLHWVETHPHWHFHPRLPLAPAPFTSGKQEAIEGRRKTTAGTASLPRSAGRGSSHRWGPLSQQPCDDAMPRSQRSREGARLAGAGIAPVGPQALARGLACLILAGPGAAGQLSYSA